MERQTDPGSAKVDSLACAGTGVNQPKDRRQDRCGRSAPIRIGRFQMDRAGRSRGRRSDADGRRALVHLDEPA